RRTRGIDKISNRRSRDPPALSDVFIRRSVDKVAGRRTISAGRFPPKTGRATNHTSTRRPCHHPAAAPAASETAADKVGGLDEEGSAVAPEAGFELAGKRVDEVAV